MTYIIAEAGTGHFDQRRLDRREKAMDFIKRAAATSVDAVKFQMFIADEPLFCPMPGDEARMKRWAKTALTLNDWKRVQTLACTYNMDLLWSAFQPTCIEWLKELKPRYVKVASRARKTFPFWDDAAYIISGHDYHRDPNQRVPGREHWVLKCIPKYPAPLEECAHDPSFYCGLSDHSGTIWPGLDAIYHQAKFLEVHFKIPGADMGNDEPVCLTVDQLKLLCEARDAVAKMHSHTGR